MRKHPVPRSVSAVLALALAAALMAPAGAAHAATVIDLLPQINAAVAGMIPIAASFKAEQGLENQQKLVIISNLGTVAGGLAPLVTSPLETDAQRDAASQVIASSTLQLNAIAAEVQAMKADQAQRQQVIQAFMGFLSVVQAKLAEALQSLQGKG